MVARLWWKEARQTWPIWAFLAVAGLTAQGVAVWYSKEAPTQVVGAIALMFTFLYVFMIGAAVFAGERETRTLPLLDALPIARWRVWAAKSSFALTTVAALGIVLYTGVVLTGLRRGSLSWDAAVVGGILLLAGLGWGLFWSSFASNALLAAALAIISVCVSLVFLDFSDLSDQHRPLSFAGRAAFGHLLIALATTTASAAIFLLTGPPRRTWTRRTGPSIARVLDRPVAEVEDVEERRFSTVWPYTASRLAWQSFQELRPVWLVLAATGWALPLAFSIVVGQRDDSLFWLVCGPITTVVAGVSVFNGENRGRTHRFLVQHGARAGIVWGVKTLIWLAAAASIWLVAGVVLVMQSRTRSVFIVGFTNDESLLIYGGHLAIGFAVAALCGMVFRRGITAGVIAVVFWITVSVLMILPTNMRLIRIPELYWIAAAILGISWGWSGQWLIDRPGVRRWVTLGLLSVGAILALVSTHAADRVWSVPILSPAEEERYFRFASLPADAIGNGKENAAELYREAMKVYKPTKDIHWGEFGGDATHAPIVPEVEEWVRQNEPALKLIHTAASKPISRFVDLGKADFFSIRSDAHVLATFDKLLIASARIRLGKGDLKGAWSEIETLFRVGRQNAGVAPVAENQLAQNYELAALSLAMQWAADARQTEESLQAAREAFNRLPPMPSASDAIRAEALILRNTANLPRAKLAEEITLFFLSGPRSEPEATRKFLADLLTTPWELARARRVFNILLASKIADAERPPWQSVIRPGSRSSWHDLGDVQTARTASIVLGPITHITGDEQEDLFKSTPLARGVYPGFDNYIERWNRNLVGRRALALIFRLRLWQVQHDGRLPESLGLLVIDGEPVDPYSSNYSYFGYVASLGQPLPALGDFDVHRATRSITERLHRTDDCWVLYSVGPNLVDDRARISDLVGEPDGGGDIVFPLKNNVKPPSGAK
jgi:hypothetical protein